MEKEEQRAVNGCERRKDNRRGGVDKKEEESEETRLERKEGKGR